MYLFIISLFSHVIEILCTLYANKVCFVLFFSPRRRCRRRRQCSLWRWFSDLVVTFMGVLWRLISRERIKFLKMNGMLSVSIHNISQEIALGSSWRLESSESAMTSRNCSRNKTASFLCNDLSLRYWDCPFVVWVSRKKRFYLFKKQQKKNALNDMLVSGTFNLPALCLCSCGWYGCCAITTDLTRLFDEFTAFNETADNLNMCFSHLI